MVKGLSRQLTPPDFFKNPIFLIPDVEMASSTTSLGPVTSDKFDDINIFNQPAVAVPEKKILKKEVRKK